MKKASVYIFVILVSLVIASLYGIIHNQISYTVAPEYFTKFKFERFGLTDPHVPERVRASMVGFIAARGMGIPIGLLVGAIGLIHRDHRRMLIVSLWSLLLVAGFTLLFGLGGLLYGYSRTRHIDIADYRGWYIPENVTNLRRFLCAGYMHNSSYLGGALAIPVAWAFHIVLKIRSSNEPGATQIVEHAQTTFQS
jgi:hypothetical protein